MSKTKLTAAQSKLLESLDEEPGIWAECDESEWRTAVSLFKKGLIQLDRPSTDSRPRRFEARTLAGIPQPTQVRDIPYGSHQFVMARPVKGDWSDFDGSTMRQGREEFRPVMISGVEEGQRIFVIGSAHGYDITKFEVGADLSAPYGAI